ncbi:MAG: hypothetical protein WBL41_16445, partial [Terracidiphilus sp.]
LVPFGELQTDFVFDANLFRARLPCQGAKPARSIRFTSTRSAPHRSSKITWQKFGGRIGLTIAVFHVLLMVTLWSVTEQRELDVPSSPHLSSASSQR